MHKLSKIKIFVRDVGKHHANISINFQNSFEFKEKFACSEAKTWGLPFNNSYGRFSGLNFDM